MSRMRPVLGTLLIIVLYDVLLRRLFPTPDPLTFFSILLGTLSSFFFWMFVARAQVLLPRFLQKPVALFIAVSMTVLLGVNFFTFWKLGDFVNAYMLMFISVDKGFVADQLKLYALDWKIVAAIPVIWIFYRLWAPAGSFSIRGKRARTALGALICAGLFLVALNQVKYETVGQHKWVDTSFFLALKNYQKSTRLNVLRSSVRTKVPPLSSGPRPDVFLFLGESFGRQYLKLYGYPEDSTPVMTATFSDGLTTRYSRGISNSSCTDVSLPSMFSGVGPEESDVKLHEMPLIWDWLKSAGYHTIFASPQKFAFANFDAFILSPGPDAYLSADRFMGLGSFIAHNNGLDDIWAAKRTAEKIAAQPKDKPLLLVFFTNATHYPFLQKSTELARQPQFAHHYQNSLAITDGAFDVLMKAFRDHRDVRKILTLVSADHGELEVHTRPVPRIASFYDEILGVPFLIRAPESAGLISEECREGLRANASSLVQNLDLLPTVLDILGFAQSPDHRDLFSKLEGKSLCFPVGDQRMLVGLDTNNIRQWNPEGFLLAKGPSRLVFTNTEGPKFFDLNRDPEEKEDLFPSLKPEQLVEFDEKIRSNPQLIRIQNLYFPEGLLKSRNFGKK